MLESFIKQHQLPSSFSNTAKQYFIPAAEDIAKKFNQKKTPYFVGINGCQGSGKSTFTQFIGDYLHREYQLNVAVISLDDFYLSRKKRNELAQRVHPLFVTRGVPGTHNTQHMREVFTRLSSQEHDYLIPRFNKAIDDPFPQNQWAKITKPIDIILFEGWCWGIPAQISSDLTLPINTLETEEDPDGIWRSYVNEQLIQHYQPLYQKMNYWIALHAPSFQCVHQWRFEQEQKLAAKTTNIKNSALMSEEQLARFIQHYQRLTEHGLSTLDKTADLTFFLNSSRTITGTNKDS